MRTHKGTIFRAGWLVRLHGAEVRRRDIGIPTTYWTNHQHPVGILFHYTAGCNGDLSGTYRANGFGGAQFSIDRDGTVYEYAPVDAATWHAYGASHYYLGIEHTALPGSCELTDAQLVRSAQLSAAIVDRVAKRFGFVVPLHKIAGPALVPGFHDHRDGTLDTWNPNGHTDHLYRWTWPRYLAAVKTGGKSER